MLLIILVSCMLGCTEYEYLESFKSMYYTIMLDYDTNWQYGVPNDAQYTLFDDKRDVYLRIDIDSPTETVDFMYNVTFKNNNQTYHFTMDVIQLDFFFDILENILYRKKLLTE